MYQLHIVYLLLYLSDHVLRAWGLCACVGFMYSESVSRVAWPWARTPVPLVGALID